MALTKNIENNPMQSSRRRRRSTKHLDVSGKSGAYFEYSEIPYPPVAPH